MVDKRKVGSNANKENTHPSYPSPLMSNSDAAMLFGRTPLSEIGNTAHTEPSHRCILQSGPVKRRKFDIPSAVNLFPIFNSVLPRHVCSPIASQTSNQPNPTCTRSVDNNVPICTQILAFDHNIRTHIRKSLDTHLSHAPTYGQPFFRSNTTPTSDNMPKY